MVAKVKAKKKPPPAKSAVKTRKGRTTTTRLSSKNQVTLPVEIIRKAGFRVGDTINCTVTKDGKIELSAPENPIMSLIGAGNGIFDDLDWRAERADAWGE
jgi:bifunctional DNA-binding transcriptional regulator/antitoxin component of YhaV-PrlF toxin-antitoxin module